MEVPLTVKASTLSSQDALSLVFVAFPRIENIELELSMTQHIPLVPLFPRAAPQLRSLTIKNTFDGLRFAIPPIFTHCLLPALQSLHIEGYMVDWGDHLFAVSRLTRLVVHSKGGTSSPISKLFEVLQGMKALQHLDLAKFHTNVHEILEETPCATEQNQIILPKLAFLRLADRVSWCTQLLQQLVFPSDALMDLDVSSITRHNLDAFAEVVFGKMTGSGVIGPSHPILTAALWQKDPYGSDSCLHFVCSRSLCDPNDILEDFPLMAALRIIFRTSQPTTSSLRRLQVKSLVPVTDLLHLGLGGIREFSFVVPLEFSMGGMSSLTMLQITDIGREALFDFFEIQFSYEDEPSRNADVLFPQLQRLVIDETKFPPHDGDDDSGFPSLDDFINALQLSRDIGHELEFLEFRGCKNLPGDDVNDFEMVVGEVEWDGYEVESDASKDTSESSDSW